MKMARLVQEEKPISGVNIVPVIGLCLVLLNILMVTAPILSLPDLPIDLPRAITIESKDRNLSVTFAPDGRVAVNAEMVTDEELDRFLKARVEEDPDVMVILRVDKTSPYGTLTDLIARCQKIGARNVSIGTEQRPEGR